MKYCPLWSLFHGTRADFERQKCIKEECGMYGLCNPSALEAKKKDKEGEKELKVFGGGRV